MFKRERVHRDVVRAARNGTFHAVTKHFVSFAGQPCNKVHVDREVILARKVVLVVDVGNGMSAPDCIQHRLIECLRIDGYTVYTVRRQYVQFVLVYRVGATCLNGIFRRNDVDDGQNLVKLHRRKRRRRATAEVHIAKRNALVLGKPQRYGKFPF